MVKQFFKKKSKRMTCRKKYKIEKKVKEHHKKLKKQANKKPHHKKKKDITVPNSLPFKEEVLKEAEQRKLRLEEERQKQKEKRKKARQNLLDKRRSLESLVQDAQRRDAEFDRKTTHVPDTAPADYNSKKSVEASRKQFYKEFKKVIDAADVVLEILDARDPLGSRCPQVEEAVLSAGTNKKLVLVLNKIDLVPRENVEQWLKHLRNELPTIAFKASTQTQRDNLSRSKIPLTLMSEDLRKSSRCLGADMLLKLLGNYCRNQDIKTAISVGVVGFPNTGKSSIINSLKRSKACHVGATPGVTRALQEVQLDKHVKLLDSPGVVMATGMSDAAVILRNCVKIESLEDPVTPVDAVLKRCNKHQIMLHYNIPDYKDSNEFLALMAKRFGRLKKGGHPDIHKAAKIVLQDWNTGKIRYYTHPPEQSSTHLQASVVTQMAKEFDIEALMKDEEEALQGLSAASNDDIIWKSSGPTDTVMDEADDEEEWQDEEDEEKMKEEEEEELQDVTVAMETGRSRNNTISTEKEKMPQKKMKGGTGRDSELNVQRNKDRKKDFKKMKKNRKRSDALAGQLSDALVGAFGGLTGDQEDYSFETDFK